jgi:hypothetical protein
MRCLGFAFLTLALMSPVSAQVTSDTTFDAELAAELAEIHERDQSGRFEWRDIQKSFDGPVPDSIRSAFWDIQNRVDAENLARVETIITERGWPGRSVVGEAGAQAVFLVIQHAPLATQERYLPLLEAAVAAGEAEGWHLAYLTDRVLVRRELPQRYGTQYRYDPDTGERIYHPIENPEELDARREALGMPPPDGVSPEDG